MSPFGTVRDTLWHQALFTSPTNRCLEHLTLLENHQLFFVWAVLERSWATCRLARHGNFSPYDWLSWTSSRSEICLTFVSGYGGDVVGADWRLCEKQKMIILGELQHDCRCQVGQQKFGSWKDVWCLQPFPYFSCRGYCTRRLDSGEGCASELASFKRILCLSVSMGGDVRGVN